jgi:hypothetical protein
VEKPAATIALTSPTSVGVYGATNSDLFGTDAGLARGEDGDRVARCLARVRAAGCASHGRAG